MQAFKNLLRNPRSPNLLAARFRQRGDSLDFFPVSGIANPKSAQPCLGSHGVAAFVVVDQVEPGFDCFACQTAFADPFLQDGRALITPAEFHHEMVPSVAFFVGAQAATVFAPDEDIQVRASLQRPGFEVGVAHPEEAAAPAIEHEGFVLAEVGLVLGGEAARGVKANLVEHAAEVDESAHLGVRAAQSGDGGHGDFGYQIPDAGRQTMSVGVDPTNRAHLGVSESRKDGQAA
jgi:hypothetical protein